MPKKFLSVPKKEKDAVAPFRFHPAGEQRLLRVALLSAPTARRKKKTYTNSWRWLCLITILILILFWMEMVRARCRVRPYRDRRTGSRSFFGFFIATVLNFSLFLFSSFCARPGQLAPDWLSNLFSLSAPFFSPFLVLEFDCVRGR